MDPSAVITGSPETVAEQMRAFAGRGYTDIIVRSMVADQQETLASLSRLAEVRERIADA
ncbi:MAG: hypothetical protein O2798_04530 [Chloroflexi bacterium]|nr:hypothetical protein [Chloroflexota bacterium]